MSFDSEVNKALNKSIGLLEINLTAKSTRTAVTLAEYIQTLKEAGIANDVIRGLLIDDLENSGRIFGEFFKSIGDDVTGQLGALGRKASGLRFGFTDETKLTWIAVSIQEGNEACYDCTPRHGEVDIFSNWKLRGLPRTGWSVCRSKCKCVLLNESDATGETSLEKPLKVLTGE